MSFVAFPGGQIFVDDKPMGKDVTVAVILRPGSHQVRIVNRFLGEFTTTIELSDGQTGEIAIHW